MIRVTNIKLTPEQASDKKSEKAALKDKAAKVLRVSANQIKTLDIARKSLDARDRENIYWLYSADVHVAGKNGYLGKNARHVVKKEYEAPKPVLKPDYRPVVVGCGPSGLFAAYVLAEAGLNPIIIERGKPLAARKEDVKYFKETGVLDENSNVHFGEGGAGAFSDGKLTAIDTVRDARGAFVFNTFVKHHAPKDILYLAKPHIGTDMLENVISSMRARIEELGGEFLFNTKFAGVERGAGGVAGVKAVRVADNTEYTVFTKRVILAVGNSARDTFELLGAERIKTLPKPFAVGLRIEHRQSYIDEILYGKYSCSLPPASYNMAFKAEGGRGVYTFCMCPGGFVAPAATEGGGVAVNGMSCFRRDGENANSAVLVSVGPKDFISKEFISKDFASAAGSPLTGVEFQRRLERAAYNAGFAAPVQRVEDFLGEPANGGNPPEPTYAPGTVNRDLREILGEGLYRPIADGLRHFDKIMPGFKREAILTGVETRSSSPVTIPRDGRLFAYADEPGAGDFSGLIPCGEGAGLAGGIVSSAIEGLRAAEAVISGI